MTRLLSEPGDLHATALDHNLRRESTCADCPATIIGVQIVRCASCAPKHKAATRQAKAERRARIRRVQGVTVRQARGMDDGVKAFQARSKSKETA